MNMPIDWYKRNLKNRKLSLSQLTCRLESLQDEINRLKGSIEFLTMQINEAEKRGKKAFDADRFLIKLKGE